MSVRKVITIDEEKCDGCGQCVPACAEGALKIIDGKARLVSETYCDGLGACLGECPQNAMIIEERETKDFNIMAVKKHLADLNSGQSARTNDGDVTTSIPHAECPGSMSRQLRTRESVAISRNETIKDGEPSRLANWPVQITLAPLNAPYFDNARLLIAADCVPFASGNFHAQFLDGRVLLIGCPKLDNMESYVNKLTGILAGNRIQSIEIAYMEVPCCYGLVVLVRMALETSGKNIPAVLRKVSIRGEISEKIVNA